MRFVDRGDAGAQLADRLGYLRSKQLVVVGVPTGGVAVAFEVARRLDAPLDIVGVHPLGAPLQPNVVIGAVGERNTRVLDRSLVKRLSVAPSWLDAETTRATETMRAQAQRLRNGLPPQPVRGRTVILVDDGTASGLTMRAAVEVLRRRAAARIVLATPVAMAGVVRALRRRADEVVCLEQVSSPLAIGRCYRDFRRVGDERVRRMLAVAAGLQPDVMCEIAVRGNGGPLMGNLAVPVGATGLVILAPGPGGGRRSPDLRAIATRLSQSGLGTLLVDLLTGWEAARPEAVLGVRLLADRLMAVTRWVQAQPELGRLPVGYFSTGSGTAAALMAAAEVHLAGAVVSCGGRPDLAAGWLSQVATPTLLIIGTRDAAIRQANTQSRTELRGRAELVVVPGSTHPLAGRATRDRVAELATTWFVEHLRPAAAAAG